MRDDQLDGEGRELEVVVDQTPKDDEQHYQTPKLSRWRGKTNYAQLSGSQMISQICVEL